MLNEQGCKETIIDSLITGNKTLINLKAKFINCDIVDRENISKVLINDKFDIIKHFDGLIKIDETLKEPESIKK